VLKHVIADVYNKWYITEYIFGMIHWL